MRRLALFVLLLWLPLHWSWAATQSCAAVAEHVAHLAVADALAEGDAPDPAGAPDDNCPQCQAADDWQAALPAMPRIAPAPHAPPQFAYTLPCSSFVPPVPKPPARLPAA